MRQRLKDSLTFRCSDATREVVSKIAYEERKTVSEASRDLLIEALKTRGIEDL
jgi:hypothetical protein